MMFYEIEFPLAALSSAEVEAALLEVGASSITFLDGGNEPVLEPKPGEIRLWSDTRVRALFDESHDAMQSLVRLADRLGPARHCLRKRPGRVENRDWERAWLADWKPMRFGGRLWVCPTEADGAAAGQRGGGAARSGPCVRHRHAPDDGTVLAVPRRHAARGALRDRLWVRLRDSGDRRLEARRIAGGRPRPGSASASRDARERRAQLRSPRTCRTLAAPAALEPADLVLANILAEPLIELAPILTAACRRRGELILSGLLRTQAQVVKNAYDSAFDMVQVVGQDDWCCIHARRAS